MVLSDKTIKEKLKTKELEIAPLNDKIQIQPASVDLRLSDSYLKMKENQMTHIDLDKIAEYQSITADEMILPPRTFILASTIEYIKIPNNITAFVEGRSSIGRMGLFIQNAGWVDPGFEGNITLELFNANNLPIKLTAKRRICQLVLVELDQMAEKPYQGKYFGQQSATGSKIHQDKL